MKASDQSIPPPNVPVSINSNVQVPVAIATKPVNMMPNGQMPKQMNSPQKPQTTLPAPSKYNYIKI